MTDPRADALRGIYDLFDRGDAEAIAALLAGRPGFEWHESPSDPESFGALRGFLTRDEALRASQVGS